MLHYHNFLLDYENTQRLPNQQAPNTSLVIITGPLQKRIPVSFVQQAQLSAEKVVYETVTYPGRHSLDLYLAFRLGMLFAENPDATFTILSHDKGFDSLVQNVKQIGAKVRRG